VPLPLLEHEHELQLVNRCPLERDELQRSGEAPGVVHGQGGIAVGHDAFD
jgi:hypothetical protein